MVRAKSDEDHGCAERTRPGQKKEGITETEQNNRHKKPKKKGKREKRENFDLLWTRGGKTTPKKQTRAIEGEGREVHRLKTRKLDKNSQQYNKNKTRKMDQNGEKGADKKAGDQVRWRQKRKRKIRPTRELDPLPGTEAIIIDNIRHKDLYYEVLDSGNREGRRVKGDSTFGLRSLWPEKLRAKRNHHNYISKTYLGYTRDFGRQGCELSADTPPCQASAPSSAHRNARTRHIGDMTRMI